MIISVFDTANCGIFIFDKHILTKKNIMSVNKKGGKRGIRVYAPWTKPLVKQALQTQKWQNQYFFSMNLEYRLKSDFISKIFLSTDHS